MEIEYVGVVDGMRTWIVRNEAGEIIGKNQSDVEEVSNGVEAPIPEVENN